MTRISMNGRAPAEAWSRKADALNQRTQQILDEVALILKEVGTDSEGTVVDDIIQMGSELAVSYSKLIEGMNGILGVVNKLLDAFMDMLNKGKEIVSGGKNEIIA